MRKGFRIWLRWAAIAVAALGLLGIVLFAIAYRNARAQSVIIRHEVLVPGLQGPPIRVLLLSDTHYGWPDMRTARLNGIVAQANALKPDLILLAGDYMGGKWMDWPRSWLEEALPPLAALQAPLGVYAVGGNHDDPFWTAKVMARQRAPKMLAATIADVGPIRIAGFRSSSFGSYPARVIHPVRRGKPLLLLMHEPSQLFSTPAHPDGFLALAGHTHGGQVVLPFIGAARNLNLPPEPCERGKCMLNGWPVIVTSGIGTSVLPIRWGVPPEMVLITLKPGIQPR